MHFISRLCAVYYTYYTFLLLSVYCTFLHQMYRRRLQESKHKKVQSWEKKTHRSPFLINLLAEVGTVTASETIIDVERWVA